MTWEPALGLGVEKPDPQVMQRPPRPQSERLLNLPLALRAYLFLGLLETTAAMAAFFFVLHGAGWKYGESLAHSDPLYLQTTTACLSAIIVMQIVNVFLCRSATRSVFSTGLIGNPLIIWGVIVEATLLLLIAYTPLGNSVLGTAPIAGNVWLFILPFAAGMLEPSHQRRANGRHTYYPRQFKIAAMSGEPSHYKDGFTLQKGTREHGGVAVMLQQRGERHKRHISLQFFPWRGIRCQRF